MRSLVFLLCFAAAAANAAPAPGRYHAILCVSTAPATPPTCGAAEFDLRSKTQASVRVADVTYHLHLRPAQLDVMTMQEKMEIDEFSAPYEWKGNVLIFIDPDKNVRYEIAAGARARGRP